MTKKSNCTLNFASDDVVLIITGCIKPNQEQRFLVLKDEHERLQQYVSSIRFYITDSPFTKITFCDNSNYAYPHINELETLAQKYNKVFEWLSFQGNDEKAKVQGKGFGEGEILHYALTHSQLVLKARSFAKVTGRLTISNIAKVVRGAKAKMNYFNQDIYRSYAKDTRFYLCDIDFYKKFLIDAYQETSVELGQERAIENIFYMHLQHQKNCRNLLAFPAFCGRSGGNGMDYSLFPQRLILLYSALCRMNLFDKYFVIVMAFRKMRLVFSKQS